MKTLLISLIVASGISAQAQEDFKRGLNENQSNSRVEKSNVLTQQAGAEVHNISPINLHENNNKEMAPQYFNDVIVENSVLDQRNAKISAAFNGWLYCAFTTSNTSNGNGGITIRRSKNNGVTWTPFYSISVANTRYPVIDMVVAGTDTNNLILYLTGVNVNTTTGVNILWFDKHNARTGVYMGTFGTNMNYGTRRVNDVAIASDYKFPAVGASPYSIGVLYSVWSVSVDSIIFVASINGGTSSTIRQTVKATGYYTRNVDLDYGKSNSGSNGRYFGVWEQLPTSSSRNGNIFTSRSASTVSGGWIAPKNLDSSSTTILGKCRNPVIAVQQNNINNDSSSTTAVILLERDFTGTGSDYDIIGFYNKKAHFTGFWNRFDVVNTSEKDNQPHIVFDPAYNNFLTVYHDSSNHRLPYCINGMNMTNPNTWGYISTQYNDLTTNIINPWPRVDINPIPVKTVHVWNSEGSSNKGVALFDAENLYTVVKEFSEATISGEVYPNPASTVVNLKFELKNVQNVTMDIFDLQGNVVKHDVFYGVSTSSEIKSINVVDLSDGVYILKLSSDNVVFTKKLVKATN